MKTAGVVDPAILAAICNRLDRALAAPSLGYRSFIVGDRPLGFIDDARAVRLAAFGREVFEVRTDAVVLAGRLRDRASRSAALADVTQALRAEGALPAWRDELYAVANDYGMPAALLIERGAARYFGMRTWAAHVNGVVGRRTRPRMWLARRSASKAVDPGMLDNLVGGGIAAGFSAEETVIKEAWEEAGIPKALAASAQAAGTVAVRRPMFDGLQRETVFVYDLWLADDFVPANQDGEAVGHRLVAVENAARIIACEDAPDIVTIDATVVIADFLRRHAALGKDERALAALDALCHGRLDPR